MPEKRSLPNGAVRLPSQWLSAIAQQVGAQLMGAPRTDNPLAREAQRVEVSAVIGADYVKARY